MQFVGEAVREHMLQSGNYEQKLVVIGIAVLGRIANREAIKKGSFSIDKVDEVSALLSLSSVDLTTTLHRLSYCWH